jgi:MYXO-CTERM domain-containing protein
VTLAVTVAAVPVPGTLPLAVLGLALLLARQRRRQESR